MCPSSNGPFTSTLDRIKFYITFKILVIMGSDKIFLELNYHSYERKIIKRMSSKMINVDYFCDSPADHLFCQQRALLFDNF